QHAEDRDLAGVALVSLRDDLTGPIRTALAVLSGAVIFILLICCANIAGMLSARAGTRSSELAIRTVLGAGRSRVVRQLLTEAVLLFFIGGIAGIAAGYGGVGVLLRLVPPELPQLQDTRLDLTVADVALAEVQLPFARYASDAKMRELYDGVLERLRHTSGIKSAAAISNFFLGRLPESGAFSIEGRPERISMPLTTDTVSPEFFSAM